MKRNYIIMLEMPGKMSVQELRLTVEQKPDFQYYNLWAKISMPVP